MKGRAVATAIAAAASLVGCGGDATLDTAVLTGPPPPAFRDLQARIFTPRCALPGCHAGPGPQQGLDLSGPAAYGSLVGVASAEIPVFFRVAPRNSADSYVAMKLAGDPRIAGERMPFGGPYLSPDEIDAVRRWIDAGAAND